MSVSRKTPVPGYTNYWIRATAPQLRPARCLKQIGVPLVRYPVPSKLLQNYGYSSCQFVFYLAKAACSMMPYVTQAYTSKCIQTAPVTVNML